MALTDLMAFRENLIYSSQTVREAISMLSDARVRVIFVVGPSSELLGSVTDGDIRRGVATGVKLDEPVTKVCNLSPEVIGSDKANLEGRFSASVRAIPVVDSDGKLEGISFPPPESTGWPRASALIMAGGFGKRLMPHTADTPKPLVLVGDRPLVDYNIDKLLDSGCKTFYLAVHHMADQVIAHFEKYLPSGTTLEVLREPKPLGTAGALTLFPKEFDETLLVINADIFTNLDFLNLVNFHHEHDSRISVGTRAHHTEIPFGVLEQDKGRVTGIVEKPVVSSEISAGVYCLDPSIIQELRDVGHIDMTEIIHAEISQYSGVRSFVIHEKWEDIGRPTDLERLRSEMAGSSSEISAQEWRR